MIKNECRHACELLDHAECLWCENCVEKLVKRLKKPKVTDEWIEEKRRNFLNGLPQDTDEAKLYLKDFIRLLVKEMEE